ncbi:MAG: hypothetical protein WC915_06275 [archaeon]|jgi:hypothetical protein
MQTKFYSLSEIPKQFWIDLNKQVMNSNGHVLFLVHPFYLEKKSGHDLEKYGKYKKIITDTLTKSSFPVIVLESHPGEIKGVLGEEAYKKANLFCLPSMDSQGALVEKIQSGNQVKAHEDRIIELLSKSGIKHISFGGSLTDIEPSYDVRTRERLIYPPRLIPSIQTISSSCAGSIYAHLIKSGKFDIVRLMPNACFPNKPKFHKRGVAKEQTQNWIKQIKKTRLINKMKRLMRLR